MDNLTHTLIGVLVGEALHQAVPASTVLSDRARRATAITVMVVGGNLPDADVIYTQWAGSTLEYLLHHRGHTHTVVGALGLSLALFLTVRLWWRYRKIRPRPADTGFLAGLSVLATMLHIGLDFTNNYGVHPFWPIDDRWYYGDAVFIIEPLIWACAAALLFVVRGRVPRVLLALLLVVDLGLSWFSGYLPPLFAAVVTVVVLGLAAVSRFTPARVAVAGGLAAWLAVTATFVVTSRVAENRLEALLADRFPAARTLEVVLTPMPANPVCREVLAVQVTTDQYVVRRAFHSLAPGVVSAEGCADSYPMGGEGTARLAPSGQVSTTEIRWTGELALPIGQLAGLAGEYCAVDALLQFARAPFAAAQGDDWIVGDLRFDREPGLGLAEVEVGPGRDDCSTLPAPWTPPREDLLTGK
jgi:inner membrane protein